MTKKRFKEFLRNMFLALQIVVDKIRGVDFAVPVYHDEINHVQTMSSTPMIKFVLRRYFKKENITNDDAIMDVGCGKGRMVYFFTKFPFGAVGGLEYSEDVFNTAKRNIEKLKGLNIGSESRGGICLVNGDAKYFRDYDRYNYIYLFNPFHGDIFEGFVNGLKESIKKRRRVVKIIYFNPIDRDILVDAGFKKVEDLKHHIEIYENVE